MRGGDASAYDTPNDGIYADKGSWYALMVENYDSRGALWHVNLAGNLGAGGGMGLAVLIHASLGHWAYVIVFLTALAVLQTLIVTLCRSMRQL